MSLRRESDCVGCGLPCLGRSCPHWERIYFECDKCGNENAIYEIDGEDFCENCAKEIIKNEWFNKSINEKISALKDDIDECLDSFFMDSDIEQQAEYLDMDLGDLDDCSSLYDE